jgi:O-antigen ligase
VNKSPEMNSTVLAKDTARERIAQLADWLAVGVAVSLPWSTSATSILIVVWLFALLPTLHVAAVRREVETAAGGLPVLLWCLAAIGMLWADVSWAERFGGLDGFHRLLVIPLLLAQFRRSENGAWVLYGFLASATVLLLVSWALVLIPGLPWRGKHIGVPVKDQIFQSAAFLICVFALIGIACDAGRARNWRMALGLTALAALFLANIAFVITSRTALLVAPVLTVLLGWRQFRWKGVLCACLVAGVLDVALLYSSPYLNGRVRQSIADVEAYRETNDPSSTGLHIEFLKKSIEIIATAPVIGHGTGSIPEQFRRVVVSGTGAASYATVNPHNQIFAVAIQLGVLGGAVLIAMWAAHYWLFRAEGLIAWFGALMVAQNVVSSLVNSHLFDFGHGWLYVFGVGVLGGMASRQPLAPRPAAAP